MTVLDAILPKRSLAVLFWTCLPLLYAAGNAAAADIRCPGYDRLQEELGEEMPTGAGLRVTHVEAAGDDKGGNKGWAPDADDPAFQGKDFPLPGLPSKHATEVGRRFYGNGATAPGIAEIVCFPNILWAYQERGVLRTGSRQLPMAGPSLVANHSWVAQSRRGANLEVLKRVDYVVATDDFIQVGGANNSSEVPDVMQCSYNAILVGRTAGGHSTGTRSQGVPLYPADRAKPDLVAPARYTSEASPMVASAAALLVDFAGRAGRDISKDSYRSPRTGRSVFHAGTSEVIKAALLAGADRRTGSLFGWQIRNYRGRGAYRTDNGLDSRYGAGQVNIYNSYHILAAGEADSAQDDADAAGRVGKSGFDYDSAFGGLDGSNDTASYMFKAPFGEARLKASLVWNLRVNQNTERWDGLAAFYDLDMELYDLDWSERLPVAKSTSWHDNTENIWHELKPGHDYELRVFVGARQEAFRGDYGLAWQVMTE